MSTYSEYCVYTVVKLDDLAMAADHGKQFSRSESKPWVTGLELWRQAQADGFDFPVLLGDATDCYRLEYWGLLTKIEIKDSETHYTVDRVRRLGRRHRPQELVLRSTRKHIANQFIRPYAICCTPPFLNEKRDGRSKSAS